MNFLPICHHKQNNNSIRFYDILTNHEDVKVLWTVNNDVVKQTFLDEKHEDLAKIVTYLKVTMEKIYSLDSPYIYHFQATLISEVEQNYSEFFTPAEAIEMELFFKSTVDSSCSQIVIEKYEGVKTLIRDSIQGRQRRVHLYAPVGVERQRVLKAAFILHSDLHLVVNWNKSTIKISTVRF